jgi:hypothetical protein
VAAQPLRDLVAARVGCALASGLDGAERAVAARWLGGYRRLDPLIVPSAGVAPTCPVCAGDLAPTTAGWLCPVCDPAP